MFAITIRRITGFVLVAVALTAAVAPSLAQQASVQLGTLTCSVDGRSSNIFGGSRDVDCAFASAFSNVQSVRYQGTISNVGLDLGFYDVSSLAWGVVAPVGGETPSLGGTYVGSTVSGAIGAGFGGHVLFGGSGNTVALQPLSVQVQTGLNATVGLVELKLSPVDEADIASTDADDPNWTATESKGG